VEECCGSALARDICLSRPQAASHSGLPQQETAKQTGCPPGGKILGIAYTQIAYSWGPNFSYLHTYRIELQPRRESCVVWLH
jgi:hypothetical protein